MFSQKQFILQGFVLALLLGASALKAQFSVNIEVTQQINCHGGNNGSLTAIVTPAGAAYTFSWSNGGSTANIADLSAGAYVVTVQNVSGGTAIATAVLIEPSELVLTALTELPLYVHPTGSVEVETIGGTLPYSYQWVNSANIPVSNAEDLIDAPASIYSLTVTDKNSCTAFLSPVTLLLTSGAQELPETDLRAFPNPVHQVLTVEIPATENLQVQIFNSMGQMIEKSMIQGPTSSISVENWPAGSYYLVFPEWSKAMKVAIIH